MAPDPPSEHGETQADGETHVDTDQAIAQGKHRCSVYNAVRFSESTRRLIHTQHGKMYQLTQYSIYTHRLF